MEFVELFKKRIEPFIAISVLILLIILAIQLYEDNQLKKEISKECGWVDEEYQCYCEKKFIDDIKLKMDLANNAYNFSNVELDK